jgi:hypothetical protein
LWTFVPAFVSKPTRRSLQTNGATSKFFMEMLAHLCLQRAKPPWSPSRILFQVRAFSCTLSAPLVCLHSRSMVLPVLAIAFYLVAFVVIPCAAQQLSLNNLSYACKTWCAVIPPFHKAVDQAVSYLDPTDGLLGVADFYVPSRYDLPMRQMSWVRRFFWR